MVNRKQETGNVQRAVPGIDMEYVSSNSGRELSEFQERIATRSNGYRGMNLAIPWFVGGFPSLLKRRSAT
jgi:hypothetical protein